PSLPSIDSKAMLVVHTLAHGATIQLHSSFAKERMVSRAKALVAARAIVAILGKTDVPKIGLIEPVLAPLWTSTCLVFIAEIDRQRNQGGANQLNPKNLEDSLDVVIATMQHFAPKCRLMGAFLLIHFMRYQILMNIRPLAAQLDAVRRARDGGRV
ncbi:hypothetical protein C8R44DRAFT_652690, partial [Mycena epipterygia]